LISPPVSFSVVETAAGVNAPSSNQASIEEISPTNYESGGSSVQSDDTSTDTGHQGRIATVEVFNPVFDMSVLKDSVQRDAPFSGKVIRMESPFGQPIENIYDGVHSGPVLGSGVSGIVRLVKHKATGVQYAVKCLDMGLIKSAEGLAQLREEIIVMCQLDHPNIVRLEEVYESISEIFLVLELCHGGDLFDRLDEQPDFHYTEAQCARLVKQMLSSVRYLHSRNIIHRDLKLENFLFSTTETGSILKMIDFGLSKHFSFGECHTQPVGTPYTVAPEIILQTYTEKCDIWAVGVITFLLLSGETPFGGIDGEDLQEVRDKILEGEIIFEPADIWDHVSDLAKDFVRVTLTSDPTARPTAKEVQRHKWIQIYSKKEHDEGTKLNPNVVEALVSFKEFSDMRKLLCEVLSFTLLPEQLNDLRVEFEKIDDGEGEISLADLKQVLLESAEARSLGGMSEQEVEDVFNALRVRKSETKIRWHEFIAAGLSQCKVDERNLTLAFDRLDHERKGFITFENVMALLGETDAPENKEELKHMWTESIRHIKGDLDRITVDDFFLIMKGQALGQDEYPMKQRSQKKLDTSNTKLDMLREGEVSPQVNRTITDIERFEGSLSDFDFSLPQLPEELDEPPYTPAPRHQPESSKRKFSRCRSRSLELRKTDFFDDVEENIEENIEENPASSKKTIENVIGDELKTPLMLNKVLSLEPRKTDFFDDDSEEDFEENIVKKPSVIFPASSKKTIENVIGDESKTALVVNKALYRAHREMRLAVMDLGKRFEEKQKRHELENKLGKEGLHFSPSISLVMRRGTLQTGLVSPESTKVAEQKQKTLNKACARSGRPRRNRCKTVSDMTGMLEKI